VAIKVLPKDLAGDSERLARFEQEARTVSGLNHPNIVTVHDVGHDGDIVYLVLELVQGKTLRDRLAKGGLPWRSTLHIAEQIAAGLAAAHAGGIVHRDLKPENVMVRDDGVVKVLDFGLAKLRSESAAGLGTATAFTSPGTVLGTAGYMSPEQARGEDADVRSDVWAIGVVLYEMLTGTAPFKGGYPEAIAHAIKSETPTPLRDASRDIPEALEQLVFRALSTSW
jgi:serine/threonine protein kinase